MRSDDTALTIAENGNNNQDYRRGINNDSGSLIDSNATTIRVS